MPLTFEDSCTGFSIRNAYFLAKASAAAYTGSTAEFQSLVGELGLATIQQPKVIVDDIKYFVGSTDRSVVLAFRGTVPALVHNWLTDATVQQVPNRFGRSQVHKGFSDALGGDWTSLRGTVMSGLTGKALFVTGHSLGAALATLAADWLTNAGVGVRGVYTFGSPRVGNSDFYRAYKPLTYRFVNDADIVPHVPLELAAWGLQLLAYKHVGTLEYLDRHGHLGEGMSDWEAKKELIINEALRLGGKWDAFIYDHGLDRYVDAIGQNLPGDVPPPVQNVPVAALAPATAVKPGDTA